jgi:GcrA cell cycle regulator
MEPGSSRNIRDERQLWWKAENRLERLTALWPNRDLSSSQIGEILGCTKNMVIAKAHRLELGPRDPNYKPPGPKGQTRDPFPLVPGPWCCWPMGHPTDGDFHFCGAPPVPGRPYCEHHAAVAYVRKPRQDSGWTDGRRQQARARGLKRHGSAAD